MTQRFVLKRVLYMPSKLEPGIVYFAEDFGAVAHLCACGCGSIVRTPLDRWSITETKDGPSLYPSIGNWQEPCQSHYWIDRGEVHWASKWTPEQISEGRRREEERLRLRYHSAARANDSKFMRVWRWVKSFFQD